MNVHIATNQTVLRWPAQRTSIVDHRGSSRFQNKPTRRLPTVETWPRSGVTTLIERLIFRKLRGRGAGVIRQDA